MKYSIEIEIEKPLAEIAELFGDEKNLAKWQPGYLGTKVVEGKTFLEYQKSGKTIEMEEEIQIDNLPTEFSARYHSPGMVMEVQNFFSAEGENRTRWVSHNACETSGIMRVMMWLMKGCARNQSLDFMTNFKALAEEGKDIRD